MSYELTITQKPAYLHAIVTGRNTKENVAAYLDEIRRECIARGCTRVLIEEHLVGPRIGTMDVFTIASGASARARGFFEAVAYVDANAESDQNMKFAETVAVNRGLRGRMFRSVADAEKWLRKPDRGNSRG